MSNDEKHDNSEKPKPIIMVTGDGLTDEERKAWAKRIEKTMREGMKSLNITENAPSDDSSES